MMLEMCNRGIEKLRAWWMRFVFLFLQAVRMLGKAYYQRAMASSGLDLDATAAANAAGNSGASSGGAPRLCDAKLSFYDDYHIMSGVPVFILNPHKPQQEEVVSSKFKHVESRDYNMRISFFNNPDGITACNFSWDDSRVASGHNDGSVRVWNTEHGTVVHTYEEMHKSSPVADVRFLHNSNSVVVSSDFHGRYVVWDSALTNKILTYRSCRCTWESGSMLSPTICWPLFSDDGAKLVYPIIHYHDASGKDSRFESCCSLCIFSVQKEGIFCCSSYGEPDPQYADRILEVHSKNLLQYAWSGFSHSKCSFLAGFHSSPDGFCILWTDFNNPESHALELDGILGCWSQNDEYIATWDIVTKNAICNESGMCYVWKVADLKNRAIGASIAAIDVDRYSHSEASRIVFEDPQGGSVFWAEFIPNLHGALGIATCVIRDTLEVVLWQVESRALQHRLTTGIMSMDTSLTDLQAWDNRWVHIQLAYGLKPLSISGDGHWLGIYSASARKGVIWDAYTGIEILNFSIPLKNTDELLLGDAQMDMMFSKMGGKFLLCSQDALLVWHVPSLAKEKNGKGVNRVALNCKDDGITAGQVICKFSQNGAFIGVCRSYSLMMSIWNLNEGWEKAVTVEEGEYEQNEWDTYEAYEEIHSMPADGNGRRFCMFAFSKDGQRVATCMGDMKILLWSLGGANQHISQPRKIAELRSKYLPAWDVCFTSGPNGKETLVVCEDIGVLLWIDVDAKKIDERQNGFGNRRARFSQDGTKGVLMPSNDVAHVWDLVNRVCLRTVTYQIWMGSTGPVPFPQNISMDGQFAVVGMGEGELAMDQGLVKCSPTTTADDLQNLDGVPQCVEMMERKEWAVIDFNITSRQYYPFMKQHGTLKDKPTSVLNTESFRIPSAAQMHQQCNRNKTGALDTEQVAQSVLASGSQSGALRPFADHSDQEGSLSKPVGYPSSNKSREYIAFASSKDIGRSAFQQPPPTVRSLWKKRDGTSVKMNFGQEAQEEPESKFPDLSTCFADTSWSYLLEYEQSAVQLANSLCVVNVEGNASLKVLEAPGLLPHKFIATSADGCRVACLSTDNQLIVWTAFATKSALPDWNDMVVSNSISNPNAVKSLLEMHGPAIINFPGCDDLTIPFHAILAKDYLMLEALVSWTVEKNVKMGLKTYIADRFPSSKKKNATILDIAVAKRAPEIVEMLLTHIPRGLGTPIDTAFIYKQSLAKLCKIFPAVFNRILESDALLVSLPEIQVPELCFSRNQFKVMTSDVMFPSQGESQEMWNEKVKDFEQFKFRHMRIFGNQAKMITAVPKVVLFPNIAQVGKQGLLRRLVLLQKGDDMYSSFLIKALIHSKWRTYGRKFLMEEIWSFALLWITFAGYALIFGGTWHLVTFHELIHSEMRPQARLELLANFLLGISWILGCMALMREGIKILNLWLEDGFTGLWYWCSHMFNWVVLISYVFLVALIGPLHFYIALTGNVASNEAQEGQKRLTVLVAMESILLSWKIQSFAQAFRATSAIIIMIREIIKGIFSFLLISFLLLSGFALGFYVLFRVELQSKAGDDLDPDEYERYRDFYQRFGNIFLSMVTAFTMMLGETQMEIFSELKGIIRVVGTVMCIGYLLAMMVILLNLLIAVMGDSYERVKNNEAIQFLKGRTGVIIELESTMSKKSIEEIRKQVGRYLHILVPKTVRESSLGWQGRLIEQNELFKRELENAVKQIRAEIQASQKMAANAPGPASVVDAAPVQQSSPWEYQQNGMEDLLGRVSRFDPPVIPEGSVTSSGGGPIV